MDLLTSLFILPTSPPLFSSLLQTLHTQINRRNATNYNRTDTN